MLHCSCAPVQLPQLPPQPSSPHTLPVHSGTHWHCVWSVEHTSCAPVQVPQTPPQPSAPHTLPVHFGAHPQVPSGKQSGCPYVAWQALAEVTEVHGAQAPFTLQKGVCALLLLQKLWRSLGEAADSWQVKHSRGPPKEEPQ